MALATVEKTVDRLKLTEPVMALLGYWVRGRLAESHAQSRTRSSLSSSALRRRPYLLEDLPDVDLWVLSAPTAFLIAELTGLSTDARCFAFVGVVGAVSVSAAPVASVAS